jgi:hypothetical protein
VRIFAENSPFDLKDRLKERSYRWSDGSDGRPKSWWIEIAEEAMEDELRFLRTEIYRWEDGDRPIQRLTAFDRFRGGRRWVQPAAIITSTPAAAASAAALRAVTADRRPKTAPTRMVEDQRPSNHTIRSVYSLFICVEISSNFASHRDPA